MLVACDFDGTLARIVPRPNDAQPLPGILEALAWLAAQSRTRVAVVSGRTLNDIRTRCPVPCAWYIGGHGMETSDGPGVAAPAQVRRDMAARVAELREMLPRWPGTRLEAKKYSVAVHFRQAPQWADAIREVFSQWADRGHYRVLLGRQVVELLPRSGQNKGQAVHRLRMRLGCDLGFYFGDDVTDEDVFTYPDQHLVGIKVDHSESSVPTAAQFAVPGPEAMLEALQEFVHISGTADATKDPTRKKKFAFSTVQP